MQAEAVALPHAQQVYWSSSSVGFMRVAVIWGLDCVEARSLNPMTYMRKETMRKPH